MNENRCEQENEKRQKHKSKVMEVKTESDQKQTNLRKRFFVHV